MLAASGAAGMAALLDKKWGLEKSPRKAPVCYGLLGVGVVAGTLLSVVLDDPIRLLVLSAIVNGVAASPFVVIMLASPGTARSCTGTSAGGRR